MEPKVSDVIIDVPPHKETCPICLEDDINVDQMFSVGECGHRFCSQCMKQHIEVRLSERSFMSCPKDGCNNKLLYRSCSHLLTHRVKEMWRQRLKEDNIPVTKRVYCPNPWCSALMSETELNINNSSHVMGCCEKCYKPFCMACKVLWHVNLSCEDYKKLNPNPTRDDTKLKTLANKKMWRQCGKCQNMIELSRGCATVRCRCGHMFCYRCGAEAGRCSHGHNFYDLTTGQLVYRPWCACLWLSVAIVFAVVVVVVGLVFLILYFLKKL
ncbi:unnamed protein product [Cochlearia groenlandica]